MTNPSAGPIGSAETMTIEILPPHPKGAPVPAARPMEVSVDHYCRPPADLPFFSYIRRSGANEIMRALREVSDQTVASGRPDLLLPMTTHAMLGHTIPAGSLGCMLEGGQPRLVAETGNVWNYLSFSRRWCGAQSSDQLTFAGIMTRTIAQNEAAVITHPCGDTFVVQDSSGFVSHNLAGPYTLLGNVQRNHVQGPQQDPYTKQVLGYRLAMNNAHKSTVAQFLNVPANHVAVLQRGHALEMLPGGSHTITDPKVTFRSFFTMGDVNIATDPIHVMTADQVSASIVLNVNFALVKPLLLAGHGFNSPWDPIKSPVQTTLGSVVSALEYRHFLGQSTLGGASVTREAMPTPGRTFNEAVQAECLRELHTEAKKYGIDLHYVQVLSRRFQGATHEAMEQLSKQAMTANQQKTIVDIENENLQKQQRGRQMVLDIENAQIEKRSKAEADAAVARANGERESSILAARGYAEALAIRTEADAKARLSLAEADAQIEDPHARHMQVLGNQVDQLSAVGARSVIVPHEMGPAAGVQAAAMFGLRAGQNAS